MAALGSQLELRRVGPRFLAVSIVLHASVLYAVGRYAWIVPLPPSASPAPPVIWLEESPLEALERAAAPPPTDQREPDREADIAHDVEAEPRPAPEAVAETETKPESEPVAEPESEPVAEPESEPVAEPVTEDAPAASGIDLEAARERAVALVIEQQQREQSYRTFSLDDLIDEPPPEDETPDVDVFVGPSSSGPSLLRPSQARTRIGRALLELCNELTGGGIGIGFAGFGIGICGEEGERADFFGHLRPAYMEMLPVCTEHELTEAQLAAAQISDPSEIETTVVKCRLVDRDAVIVVPEF